MTDKKITQFMRIFSIVLLLLTSIHTYAQDNDIAAVKDSKKILPERERARVMNEWLRWRQASEK